MEPLQRLTTARSAAAQYGRELGLAVAGALGFLAWLALFVYCVAWTDVFFLKPLLCCWLGWKVERGLDYRRYGAAYVARTSQGFWADMS